MRVLQHQIRHRQSAFSTTNLIANIFVLGCLLAIISGLIPELFWPNQPDKKKQAIIEEVTFKNAMEQFYSTYGYYPVTNYAQKDPAQVYREAYDILTDNSSDPLTSLLNSKHEIFIVTPATNPFGQPYRLKLEPAAHPTNIKIC